MFSIWSFLILITHNSSASKNIHCKYEYWNFEYLDRVYHCDIDEDPDITDHISAEIMSIRGTHEGLKSDFDVNGLYIADKTINYFPKSLENFFANIKAIYISSCGLKEIHQSDLKHFTDLIYLCLKFNLIEVIEEGLFDFNTRIGTIIFNDEHIIHIDPDVFDNLPELVNFLLINIQCINVYSDDTNDIKEIIENSKTECVSSEFTELNKEFEKLESSFDNEVSLEITEMIENFEDKFNASKFSNFRPLNYKHKNLKSKFYAKHQKMSKATWQTSTSSHVDDKFEDLKSSQCGMTIFLSDIKSSQDKLENSFMELKTIQNVQKSTLSEILTSVTDQCSKTDQQSLNAITELTKTINNLSTSQNATINALGDLKVAQESIKSSQNTLKSSQEALKSSQDNLHSSMSDMEVVLSDLKKSQSEFKDNLMKIKNSQNEVRISLNNIGQNKHENQEEKIEKLEDKMEKFDQKLGNIEGFFVDSKAGFSEKLRTIEKELISTRHKMSVNFDEKLKGSEKRIAKKFEEILEQKLEKILKN